MILAANRCRDRSPNVYIADSLSEVGGILNPRLGDVAIVAADGVIEGWRLVESDDVGTGLDVIESNSCEHVWIRSDNIINGAIFGLVGDDDTLNDDALARAVSLARSGATLYLPRGTFRISEPWVIDKSLFILGTPGAVLHQATQDQGGIRVAASNVIIRDIGLIGPQFSDDNIVEHAIHLAGTSAANPVENIQISNCNISSWGQNGIFGKWANDLDLCDNKIEDIFYAGIQLLSCQRGTITKNRIKNIVSDFNAYGIAMTRVNSDSLVTDPRTSDFVVSSNVIRDVTHWEGIDTHGGERIAIVGNNLYGCHHGISVTRAPDGSGTPMFASLNVTVVGNTLDSGVDDGTAGEGILMVGVTGGQKTTGCVVGNIIRRYGNEDWVPGSGGIFTQFTEGLVISGNVIIEPSKYGIVVLSGVLNASITGNTIIDAWTNAGEAVGIRFRDDGSGSSGVLGGNICLNAGKVAPVKMTYGIRVAPGNFVELGVNRVEGATLEAVQFTNIGDFSGTFRMDSYLEGGEIADPDNPGVDRGRLYFRDNGAGKTQLCVRFNTGAIQVISTEP